MTFDYYENEKKNLKNSSLIGLIDKMMSITDKYEESTQLKDFNVDDICMLSASAELIDLRCRANMEEKRKELPDWDIEEIELSEGFMQDIPCRADFDGKALIVTTPLTIKRGNSKSLNVQKENYALSTYVAVAIKYWQRLNPEVNIYLNQEFVHGELVCIIKRKANHFNKNVHCDNDNIENGRVLNVMCSALGCSDNCKVMDLVSCFRENSKPEYIGTEFIITKRKNLNYYLGI